MERSHGGKGAKDLSSLWGVTIKRFHGGSQSTKPSLRANLNLIICELRARHRLQV